MTQTDIYTHSMDKLRAAAINYTRALDKGDLRSDAWMDLLRAAKAMAKAHGAFIEHLDKVPTDKFIQELHGDTPDPKNKTDT